MRIATQPQRLVSLPLVLGLLVWGGLARAQVNPLPATMKPYTETLPGTDIKFDLVPIPGGTFEMGSPADEENRAEDEGPQHAVKINPFWMGKHEVTWDEFDIFAFSIDIKRRKQAGETTPSATDQLADAVTRPTPPYADMTFGFGHDGQPAICMTHHGAMEYCRWLSAKTGKIYRLPTEAEWEYACRAGTKTPYSCASPTRSMTTPGTSTTPRSRCRWARRSPIPSACSTCTATWPSG